MKLLTIMLLYFQVWQYDGHSHSLPKASAMPAPLAPPNFYLNINIGGLSQKFCLGGEEEVELKLSIVASSTKVTQEKHEPPLLSTRYC